MWDYDYLFREKKVYRFDGAIINLCSSHQKVLHIAKITPVGLLELKAL